MSGPGEYACLAIADISGYTRYLTGSELDHAQDVLADLMETTGASSGSASWVMRSWPGATSSWCTAC